MRTIALAVAFPPRYPFRMHKTLIDAVALARLIEQQAVFVLDCRADLNDPSAAARMFAEGHIPGAVRLDLEDDLSRSPGGKGGRHPLPQRARLAKTLAEAGLSAGQQAVVYDDQGGAYAARAWWVLRWMGHEAVALLDGGIQAWREAGGAIEAGAPRVRPAGDFEMSPEPAGWTCDVGEIERGGPLVIDARTAERFRGEPHPLDTASGHVPGARNRFYRLNLDDSGRFKPAEQLRAEYEALLAGTPPQEVVMQCGSGVTACHSLLAMEHAGLRGARLWPGSWSEWTSDPGRPIARD